MKRRLVVSVAWAAWLVGCGVEAGNPHPTKPPTGSVQIFFAQSPRKAAESLQLKLAGVELRAGEGNDETAAALSAETQSVDLYALTDATEVLAARSEEVPVGTYEKLVVTLADAGPAVYRETPDGAEEAVELATAGAKSIRIVETVEITEGAETKVIVTLDPKRSLVPKDGMPDKKVLRPVGGVHPKERNRTHEGMIPDPDAVWVCAYLYGKVQLPPPPTKRPDPAHGPGMPPPPPPGVDVQNRPIFGDASQVVKDKTAECPNAFDRVPVIANRFVFRHLPPATFDFRVFKLDGTFFDLPSGVSKQ